MLCVLSRVVVLYSVLVEQCQSHAVCHVLTTRLAPHVTEPCSYFTYMTVTTPRDLTCETADWRCLSHVSLPLRYFFCPVATLFLFWVAFSSSFLYFCLSLQQLHFFLLCSFFLLLRSLFLSSSSLFFLLCSLLSLQLSSSPTLQLSSSFFLS